MGFLCESDESLCPQWLAIAHALRVRRKPPHGRRRDGWPEYTPKGTTSKVTGVPPFVYFEPNSYSYQAALYHIDATYPGLFVVIPNTPYGNPTPANQGMAIGLMPTTNVWRQNPPPPPAAAATLTSMLNEWGFAVPYANNCTGSSLTAWNAKKFQIIAPGLDCEYGGSQYELAGEGRYYCADRAANRYARHAVHH